MKPYRIKADVYCEETQAVHTITVVIDPKTLTITDRYSPCDINDIAPELALCCQKPACVQSFDEHMPPDKTAYQHPVVMRFVMQKRGRLRAIERRLIREYILAVFDNNRQPPIRLLQLVFGFARSCAIYRIVLETMRSIQQMQPNADTIAECFHLVNGFDPVRKADTQFYAQVWSEIARKSFHRAINPPFPPSITWPIVTIGKLITQQKATQAQLAWDILQPAIDDYLSQVHDTPKLLDWMIKQYLRYASVDRKDHSAGYAILKDLARLQAKHFRSKSPVDIEDAASLVAKKLSQNDIQAIHREYPQKYLAIAMENTRPSELDNQSNDLV